MNYCYDIGRIIPDYISVVGFGNCSMSSIYRPTLTTVNEPYYDIGAILSRRLIKTLKKEETVKGTTTLPFEIIERNSVKEYSFYKKTERKNRSNWFRKNLVIKLAYFRMEGLIRKWLKKKL